jgi:hypothetical protein
MIRLGTYSGFRQHARWLATLGLSLSSGVDIITTASLCYYLRLSRLEALTLKPVIDSLFLYTFENGALTCLSTFITMICWVTMPDNIVFMGFHFLIAKVFGNTLLITLNTRQQLRKVRRSTVSGLPMTSIDFDFRKNGKRVTRPETYNTVASDPHIQSRVRPQSSGSTEIMVQSPTSE